MSPRLTAPPALLVLAMLDAGAATATAVDLPEMKSRGTLKILVSADEEAEMYNFKPTGEPGFERELLEGFANLHKLKLEVVPIERFEDIIPDLQKGQGDVITGIISTEARRKIIDFTIEVLPARHVVATYKPHRVVSTVDEFKEERVGVIKGTTWAEVATAAGVPASRIQAFPDRVPLFEALRNDTISATVLSLSDLTLAMRKDKGLQAGLFLGVPTSACWGVRKKDPALLAALSDYVSGARRGQTWSRLIVKYFGEDALGILGRASKQ